MTRENPDWLPPTHLGTETATWHVPLAGTKPGPFSLQADSLSAEPCQPGPGLSSTELLNMLEFKFPINLPDRFLRRVLPPPPTPRAGQNSGGKGPQSQRQRAARSALQSC